jgi:aminopeptidase N
MKKKNIFLLGFYVFIQTLLFNGNINCASASPESRIDNLNKYDVLYYKLDIIPDIINKKISGSTLIRVKVVSPVNELIFHLNNRMCVDSVLNNNTALIFTHENNLLKINLSKTFQIEDQVFVNIFYSGAPDQSHFLFGDLIGKPMICTGNSRLGASNWFPCKDIPWDKADNMDIVVTVPEQMTAVSCGKLVEEKALGNGKKKFWWHEKYPIAPLSVGISVYEYQIKKDFVLIGGDSLDLYFYYCHEHKNRIQEVFEKTKEMLIYYSESLGEYPFMGEKFAMVETVFGRLSSGHNFISRQTFTEFVLDGSNQMFFDDAMMGQWFGQMITFKDFHHIWLKTGIIEWGRYFWYEWFDGNGINTNLQEAEIRRFKLGTIYVEDVENIDQYDWRLIISKASWVIHMLRYVLGEGMFFRSMRTICSDEVFRYGNITTEQFRQVCEVVSGMELDWFFQQWIYDVGCPEFQLRYKITDLENGKYEISGGVEQIQTVGPIFTTPIEMTIKSFAGDSSFTFWIDERKEQFSRVTKKNPKRLVLNENIGIVCKVNTFDESKLVFQNYKLKELIGNGNQNPEAGETFALTFSVKNVGLRVITPTILLRSSSNEVEIKDSEFVVNTIEFDSVFTNENYPFVFSIKENTNNCFVDFTLKVLENNAELLSRNFVVSVGQSELLLLDSSQSGVCEIEFRDIFWKANKHYQYWETENDIFPDSLNRFKALIWFTGEAKDNLLNNENKLKLIDYLSQGGNLLVSSQNLAYDLTTNANLENSLFLANYLGVKFIADVVDDTISVGIEGDPITNHQYAFFYGMFGIKNQQSRDLIKPVTPAISIFKYFPSQSSAGVRLTLERFKAKVVYLPFGMEGIGGPRRYTADSLLTRIINWFDSPITNFFVSEVGQNKSVALLNNHPNPFNNTTKIQFTIEKSGEVVLNLYNIKGQKIKTLFSRHATEGSHVVLWNGSNDSGVLCSSGIFICRLKQQNTILTKKITYIK